MDSKNIQREVQGVLDMMQEQLPRTLSTGTHSFAFPAELALGAVLLNYDPCKILHEIGILECTVKQVSRTKPATAFTGPHLAGLWHKHHFQIGFMIRNLQHELERDRTVQRLWGGRKGEIISQEMVNELVDAVVHGNMHRRGEGARLTGEWIVFRRDSGRNHYLTLASHREDDEAIAARVADYDAQDQMLGEQAQRPPCSGN